ncbi:ATP-binding protein [Homoserinimonas sp. A447]
MTSVTIEAIEIFVATPTRNLGTTVELRSGLNVIRASNNRGKTQIIQALIYGLGMERMLNARANAPMGSAVTNEIAINGSETTEAVVESWVVIQLRNDRNEFLTVQRMVAGENIERNLVRFWRSQQITGTSRLEDGEYAFLHAPGSASHDAGFHTILERFFGWDTPNVDTFSSRDIKLYMDTIFPFLIVDQQAWNGVAPRKVSRYQIRDVHRKAAEFLLSLDGPIAERQVSKLERKIAEETASWNASVSALNAITRAVGGRVSGLPSSPAGSRRSRTTVSATHLEGITIQTLMGDEWVDADVELENLNSELSRIEADERLATTESLDGASAARFSELQGTLREIQSATQLVQQNLDLNQARLSALDGRLVSLQEERNRNVDLRTLERLGAEIKAEHLMHHSCPTCSQSLDNLESIDPDSVLTVGDTVQLLNAQILTTQRMHERSIHAVDEYVSLEAALTERASGLTIELAALRRDTLNGSSLESNVARKVRLKYRVNDLGRALLSAQELLSSLQLAAAAIAESRNEVIALEITTPPSDQARLGALSARVQQLLAGWGFGSYGSDRIQIDPDSLVPSREGFDLNTDVSASDIVRVKLAYLEALRELASTVGNHPGVLVLDEPRQQDMEASDFEALMQHFLEVGAAYGQVIVTTSSPTAEFFPSDSHDARVIDFGDHRVLRELAGASRFGPVTGSAFI